MGKQEEKNKHMILFIFGAIILLTGAIFAINSNKKILPVFNIDPIPATIPTLSVNSATTAPSPSISPIPTFAPVTQLKIEDIKIGMGAEVASGSAVAVNYIGRLTNGQIFDTSLTQGRQPLTFQIGGGSFRVIKGWEEGLIGMRVGGQRRLTIPPDKAYGAQGAGQAIPPNATLIFDIELLDVK